MKRPCNVVKDNEVCGKPGLIDRCCSKHAQPCQVCKEPIHPQRVVCSTCLEKHEFEDEQGLIFLTQELLRAANLLMERENLVQPFMGIVMRHIPTITKYNLLKGA